VRLRHSASFGLGVAFEEGIPEGGAEGEDDAFTKGTVLGFVEDEFVFVAGRQCGIDATGRYTRIGNARSREASCTVKSSGAAKVASGTFSGSYAKTGETAKHAKRTKTRNFMALGHF
jgi:hypothetical protein